MVPNAKMRVRKWLTAVIAAAPWLIAMYAFFWLDSTGTWTADTPHRGKMSVAILASGMGLSFFVWSVLARRHRNQ